ncbi:MAG: ROK family protein [Thermomicrobiales bacterium]
MAGRERVIGIDLGGTNLRAAVVSSDGLLSCRQSVPSGAADGPDAVIERMARLIAGVAADADLEGDAPVGVASPGPLSPRTGIVHFTPNLPGWLDVPLRDRLSAATGRRVVVDNDANCATVGEARFGVARGASDVVYLGLGTGVGGGVITKGALVDGALGLGGELGHVVVSIDGPRCTCGSVGCLEAFVSGWAIGREGAAVAATADGSAIRDAAEGQPVTASAVARAAMAGDAAARSILERSGIALGAAIGGFINIFNPDLVVIGGGLVAVGDLVLEPARRTIPRHSFRALRDHARLVFAELGDDSGLYGAAAIALDRV